MKKKTDADKAKRTYGLFIIKEDAEKGISKKFIDTGKVRAGFWILLGLFVVFIVASGFMIGRFVTMTITMNHLKSEMNESQEAMETTVSELQSENDELSGKVAILSNQMAVEMEKNQEQAEQCVPTGLPVSGKVTIIAENAFAPVEDDEEQENQQETSDSSKTVSEEEEAEFLTIFGVQRGSIVMAAANGTVTAINTGTAYGTALWIDHGNGYQTVYYYDGKPKVKEKDEVLRGTLLFEVEQNNRRMCYQIIQDGYFINPMNLMAISG